MQTAVSSVNQPLGSHLLQYNGSRCNVPIRQILRNVFRQNGKYGVNLMEQELSVLKMNFVLIHFPIFLFKIFKI